MAKTPPKIRSGEFTRAHRAPWMFNGKVVTCSSCGDELGGRLLLRTVERGLFGTRVEPSCIECLIEDAIKDHGFFDLGCGPTDGRRSTDDSGATDE